MTEENVTVSRKNLLAVLKLVLVLSNKLAGNPLLHAAIAADEDMRRLRLAIVELRKELDDAN
jgi:hypothetical protein